MVVLRATVVSLSLSLSSLVSHRHRLLEDYFYLCRYRAHFIAHSASSDIILEILDIRFEVNVGTIRRQEIKFKQWIRLCVYLPSNKIMHCQSSADCVNIVFHLAIVINLNIFVSYWRNVKGLLI